MDLKVCGKAGFRPNFMHCSGISLDKTVTRLRFELSTSLTKVKRFIITSATLLRILIMYYHYHHHHFSLVPISNSVVRNVRKWLRPTESVALHGIPGSVTKSFSETFVPLLKFIFSLSLSKNTSSILW